MKEYREYTRSIQVVLVTRRYRTGDIVYIPTLNGRIMGFKKTSATITVSNRIEQTAPDTYTQLELDLPLDTLNNEIFVVLAIDFALAPSDIDLVGGASSATFCQLSSTSQTGISGLENSNILARGENAVSFATDGAGNVAVPFSHMSNDTPTGDVDYIGIIATPSCYLAIDSTGQATNKAVALRMWGYRAKADAATYAALVQSEVLSA